MRFEWYKIRRGAYLGRPYFVSEKVLIRNNVCMPTSNRAGDQYSETSFPWCKFSK